MHQLSEAKCDHESVCVPASSNGCDTAQAAEHEIHFDSRLEQRIPSDPYAEGSAISHRFPGAWHGSLWVYLDHRYDGVGGPATFQQLSER